MAKECTSGALPWSGAHLKRPWAASLFLSVLGLRTVGGGVQHAGQRVRPADGVSRGTRRAAGGSRTETRCSGVLPHHIPPRAGCLGTSPSTGEPPGGTPESQAMGHDGQRAEAWRPSSPVRTASRLLLPRASRGLHGHRAFCLCQGQCRVPGGRGPSPAAQQGWDLLGATGRSPQHRGQREAPGPRTGAHALPTRCQLC